MTLGIENGGGIGEERRFLSRIAMLSNKMDAGRRVAGQRLGISSSGCARP
jgi:hypothetical protein